MVSSDSSWNLPHGLPMVPRITEGLTSISHASSANSSEGDLGEPPMPMDFGHLQIAHDTIGWSEQFYFDGWSEKKPALCKKIKIVLADESPLLAGSSIFQALFSPMLEISTRKAG